MSSVNKVIIIGNLGRDPEALRSRLMRRVSVDETSGCWVWIGAKNRGYGIMSQARNKSPFKTHRLSYELHVGPIPAGLGILHRCDNPPCCNPDHLVPGTQRDNMRDASRRGRLNTSSLANLQPGARGVWGAAPKKLQEDSNVVG